MHELIFSAKMAEKSSSHFYVIFNMKMKKTKKN